MGSCVSLLITNNAEYPPERCVKSKDEEGHTESETKVFKWYLRSSKGGNARGQYSVGVCYQNGIGIDKDDNKAFEWYMKSAKGGDPCGQYNVGNCYENGIGVEKDEGKAFKWYFRR
ncbi:HCP-like protein [Gigaspora margarita]|uniref:HCP-like protein n=1 Tax=Gigaspora margarita TaxID=4874 RepID=A0A8H3XM82_GIGMA|nr:HCP-like protein [Gigaspora margarita]